MRSSTTATPTQPRRGASANLEEETRTQVTVGCGRGQRSDAVTRTGYATGALGCLGKVRDEHAHLEDLARHHGHLDEVNDPPPGDAEREEAVNVVLLRAQGVSGWVGGREVGPARESGRAWAGMADARTGGREGRGGERTKLAQQIEKVRASTVKLVPKETSSLHFQSSLLPGDVGGGAGRGLLYELRLLLLLLNRLGRSRAKPSRFGCRRR